MKESMEDEFQQFFLLNFPKVKNFARMLLKSEEDAEDVSQDLFLKLWMQPQLWHGKNNVDGYIYQMAKNLILDRFKHVHVEREYLNEAIPNVLLSELIGENKTLEHMYYEDIKLLIHLTLAHLPEKRALIFRMSRFMHLSNKEIAEQLGLSVRTVEHQIYLVLTELKKTIFLFFFFYLFK